MSHFTVEQSGLYTTLALESLAAAADATALTLATAIAPLVVDALIGSITGMPEIGAEPNPVNVAVFNEDVAPQVKGQRTLGATAITVAMVPGGAGQAELAVALADAKPRYFRMRIATTKDDAAKLTALVAADKHEDFYFLAQVVSYSPGGGVDADASATIGLAVKGTVYGPLTTA